MTKRGVGKAILKTLKDSPRPLCTREIAERLKIAWHTTERYCLNLQLEQKLDRFIIGKTTAWYIKK